MGMNSKRYCPSWLVYAVRVKFVPAFTAVTFAPGTTAPLLSATVPYKVVVVCACNAALPKPAHKASTASKDVLVIGNLPAQPGADEKIQPQSRILPLTLAPQLPMRKCRDV